MLYIIKIVLDKLKKMKRIIIILVIPFFYLNGQSQSKDKLQRYFADPIIIDTTNTILIPTKYNSDDPYSKFGKTNYYANILITKTDSSSSKKLFEKDTYINPLRILDKYYFRLNYNYKHSKSIYNNWIFFLVKNNDLNKNKKIDENDPTILYLTDLSGNNLKQITKQTENTIDYYVSEKQNVIIVKIQRDFDKDNEFTSKDKDYYYLFLDYDTLKEIKRIEIY